VISNHPPQQYVDDLRILSKVIFFVSEDMQSYVGREKGGHKGREGIGREKERRYKRDTP
jgi:hypothetical protein